LLWLTNKKIQLPDIEARLLIVVARQLKQRKPVLIGRKPAAFRLVQVDEAAFDDELAREGLPSLSAMRTQFSKVIRRVVGRGSINNDVEYYAVRNAVEVADGERGPLWKLLSAYEQRLAG
jgi:hypothetical protein